uniref:Uncharacterized protein n=1 Tax=Trichuris muris TaxID=70415 RepID=A0A5S6Q897_TRIMR
MAASGVAHPKLPRWPSWSWPLPPREGHRCLTANSRDRTAGRSQKSKLRSFDDASSVGRPRLLSPRLVGLRIRRFRYAEQAGRDSIAYALTFGLRWPSRRPGKLVWPKRPGDELLAAECHAAEVYTCNLGLRGCNACFVAPATFTIGRYYRHASILRLQRGVEQTLAKGNPYKLSGIATVRSSVPQAGERAVVAFSVGRGRPTALLSLQDS